MIDPLKDLLAQIEAIEKVEHYSFIVAAVRDHKGRLVPANDNLRRIVNEAERSGVEVQLSLHAPATNDEGEPCVWKLEKPKFFDRPDFNFDSRV
jgi:predicted TIM-barrel fold metal-dependent hydrolase